MECQGCGGAVTFSLLVLEHPRADSERGGDGEAGGDGMIKLEKCPHCGSDVILCSLNGLTYMAYEFSIVCPGCGLETRITYNPSENCCFDKGEAVKRIVEKWNRRENSHDDARRSD